MSCALQSILPQRSRVLEEFAVHLAVGGALGLWVAAELGATGSPSYKALQASRVCLQLTKRAVVISGLLETLQRVSPKCFPVCSLIQGSGPKLKPKRPPIS
ncbi:hypothetical protein NDU88_006348 [Pleurodeles waltl]|uniref:Uncharacterized protein n=1 Tax=Pleurodeles waltl TaxID=8319 RepID=A0AAV7TXF0_PLEWA|nr:hypothetical protein NDU88_006348 [Pleurodeles waltl]